jgi:two-component system, chemotaxis family, protein-glutamate methylesterase/glutaminase
VTRVLLVDDSALARRLMARVLLAQGMEIAGEATDPYVARDLIVELKPDVVVLDLEMPRIDGISFLERLMQHHPLPVVVCSSFTAQGGEMALRALAAGALSVVSKPTDSYGPTQMARDLVAAVRGAAQAARSNAAARTSRSPQLSRPAAAPRRSADAGPREVRLIAIGASTGGTVAVENVLQKLRQDSPPLLVVQHLPAYIVPSFAARLNQLTSLRVELARDGASLTRGLVLIAPGDAHLLVASSGGELGVKLWAGEKINGHRPAVDALFQSAAEATSHAIGVLLTGMGRDGARGLQALHQTGARTLVQDEASSVVWGMPKAALELGVADEVLPLDAIGPRLNQLCAAPAGNPRTKRPDPRS